jgi:hypothetical protein
LAFYIYYNPEYYKNPNGGGKRKGMNATYPPALPKSCYGDDVGRVLIA